MINFDYYKNVFDGKKIQSEEEFGPLCDRAVRYISFVTSKPVEENEIADAVCALCELYYETDSQRGIKSESIDGVSVTYDNDNDKLQKSAYSILKLYLPSRLLYRGL